MTWLLVALLGPLAWSIANYLDKCILSNAGVPDESSGGGLLILSSLASLVFAGGIALFGGTAALHVDSQVIGALMLSGMFEGLYILFYFFALEREATTTVIALFQFAPVFGLLFGYFMLGEMPNALQLLAVLLILVGTLALVTKQGERITLRGTVLGLMVVSTLFVGLYSTIFKVASVHIAFWPSVFWQYVGIGIVGVLLALGVPMHRKQFWRMLRGRGGSTLGLTALAELMNILALLATNAAVLLAPVALVLSVSSVQPVFVLLEGFLLTAALPKLFPRGERPVLTRRYLLGIVLVVLGGFLIY